MKCLDFFGEAVRRSDRGVVSEAEEKDMTEVLLGGSVRGGKERKREKGREPQKKRDGHRGGGWKYPLNPIFLQNPISSGFV